MNNFYNHFRLPIIGTKCDKDKNENTRDIVVGPLYMKHSICSDTSCCKTAFDILYQNTDYVDVRILKDLVDIDEKLIQIKVYYESKKKLLEVFLSLDSGGISFHKGRLYVEVFWYEDDHVCCKPYLLSEIITRNRGLFGYKYDPRKMYLNNIPISIKTKKLWNGRFAKEYNSAD